ncbi:hypothetical protein OE88DRAFT_1657048 [Heliocybe sulcata]|uniref:Uncharacterized protein n=1 Tax=Heliocybe sulcata TaxID=5364 RepID=A0A5C3N785_9AGAM|nr:hypothetical protein OE88DRAFT_1657048 [Heliocybe sulcata]
MSADFLYTAASDPRTVVQELDRSTVMPLKIPLPFNQLVWRCLGCSLSAFPAVLLKTGPNRKHCQRAWLPTPIPGWSLVAAFVLQLFICPNIFCGLLSEQ